MDNRKEYAYLLCVGGKIQKVIAKWWSTPQEMHENMGAMHAAAYAFKKTAAILVTSARTATAGNWRTISRQAA